MSATDDPICKRKGCPDKGLRYSLHTWPHANDALPEPEPNMPPQETLEYQFYIQALWGRELPFSNQFLTAICHRVSYILRSEFGADQVVTRLTIR